jgi:cell division protein ZipA
MIQGILAIVLLVLAAVCYWWGRRPADPVHSEDPDVILGLTTSQEQPIASPVPASAPPPPLKPVPPPATLPLEIEILFLRASQGRSYSGYELLQCLLTCGLRFGENNIFHRYEHHPDGQVVLFSVAADTKNGELKPSDMGDFNCPGLSFFITLNNHVYPSVNFELMLDTARQLMEDLGGVLLDENQAPLIPEKIQQIRDKIKRFETSQQTMELFV